MAKKLYGYLLILGLFVLSLRVASGLATDEPRLGDPPWMPERPSGERAPQAETRLATIDAGEIAFLPAIYAPPPWTNTAARAESLLAFRSGYLGTENVDVGWQGDIDSCIPGTTSPAFRAALFRRINYFREMAGISGIQQLDDILNVKDQAAALMMSANKALEHFPPTNWKCYTEAGGEAASHSNLALGFAGTDAISYGYMMDSGANNIYVGHRRWILYPQTQLMGTGDVTWQGSYPSTNALWVVDVEHVWDPRPPTRDDFVAWPPPGYVPYQVVYPRWSFSYPGAYFGNATVTMTREGSPVDVVLMPVYDGFGENTLVWEPQMSFGDQPAADTSYTIVVADILIDDQPRDFLYTVIVFDPAQP